MDLVVQMVSNILLQDSGLTVISSLNIRISQRDTIGCNRISRRKRSSGKNMWSDFEKNCIFKILIEILIKISTTDELSGIIATHPCCMAGDLFGRNLTEEKDCFEEGKSVFNLTGSTGCSKVFYRCCKRYIIIPLGPSNPGWNIWIWYIQFHKKINNQYFNWLVPR